MGERGCRGAAMMVGGPPGTPRKTAPWEGGGPWCWRVAAQGPAMWEGCTGRQHGRGGIQEIRVAMCSGGG